MKWLIILALGGGLALTGEAAAQTNWPAFRGPNASGIASGPAPALQWDVTKGERVRWRTPIPGLGHASPVIWGDRLIVTTAVNQRRTAPLKVGLYGDGESAADDDTQQWQVWCLDKNTGERLWQQTAREGIPRARRHPKATHANCTVATDGDSLVAFFGSEGLYCYSLAGQLRWQKDLGTLRSSPMVYNDAVDTNGWMLEWGFASSPIIYDHRVFLQCDVLTNGFLAAFNLADGTLAWRVPRDDTATWSTPNLNLALPHPQLLVNGWKHMGGYDLATGREVWRMAGGGDCPVPTPMVANGLLYFMSAHGPRKPIYAVRPDAVGDISLRDGETTNRFVAWSSLRGGSYMETPLLLDGLMYTCQTDGILSCLDAVTGRQFYKERLGTGGEGFMASPVAAGGQIYFASEAGTVYVVAAGKEFRLLATNQLTEPCLATPAIAAGTIYFRTQSHVVAIAADHQ